MLLYIARHAWAGHFGDPGWADDSLRELTPAGIERFRRVAAALVKRGVAPARIATSPYARCAQTARLLAAALDPPPPVEELAALEPGLHWPTLRLWTDANREAGDLAWVGHNPDVERLVVALTGDRASSVRFAKGSMAALRFDGPVREGEGRLEWHVTAKSLGL